MQDKEHVVQAISMESLMETAEAPGTRSLINQFSQVHRQSVKAFNRPYGKVDILLGMFSRLLHCRDGQKSGELQLNKSIFAPGLVLNANNNKDKTRGVLQMTKV